MWRNRFILAVILSCFLLLLAGFARSPEGEAHTGLYREEFWRAKIDWPPQFDVVLAGDSRVLCDLSPESMREVLPGKRIANFGFNYVGLTAEYLTAVEKKLDPASNDKVIVLGITPRALTPLNERVSGYVEEKNRPVDEVFVDSHFAPFISFFRPVSIVAMKRALLHEEVGYKDFYKDGWMSVKLLPPNPKADLGVYQKVFVNNQISPNLVEGLLAAVEDWRRRGIRVFAFRPPASPEIVEVENRLSGFKEQEISQSIQQMGGAWVQIGLGSYEICDGSHLRTESARAFSRDLAGFLKDKVADHASGSGAERN